MASHLERDREQGPASLVRYLIESRPFLDIRKTLGDGASLPAIGGVTGSLYSLLAIALLESWNRPLVLLVATEDDALGVAKDLEVFGRSDVLLMRGGKEALRDRRRAVMALRAGGARRVVVTSVRAAVDPLPAPSDFAEAELLLALGDHIRREDLIARLSAAGFVRESLVVAPQTFAARGDIIDVYTPDDRLPLRIEFLDDQVDGLRRFDPATQVSVEILDVVKLCLLVDSAESSEARLHDYLQKDAVVLSRDQLQLGDALSKHLLRYAGREREDREDAWIRLKKHPEIMTTRLKGAAAEVQNLGGQIIAPDGTTIESAVTTLERLTRAKDLTVVFFETEAERLRFQDVLKEAGARPDLPSRWLERPLCLAVGRVLEGFHAPYLGIAAVSHHELFATVQKRRTHLLEEDTVSSRPLDDFSELREGDYVVHLGHGIAKFIGLERIVKGGSAQDFLALRFQDDVKLLVPAAKFELVQRYLGGKGEAPELSKIGSSSWEKRKEAVQAAVTDLAAELLELHAIRERSPGIAHPSDTPWQQEFEAAFPHVLTRDQRKAVEELKRDLEANRPMDRLICGDVGYGKTEVAMRAAFKVVMGGRQVAVLVPTTILAQQHWDTFRARMQDYPVTVECLSRFRSEREQKSVLEAVASGGVDILIGTHRIVQNDVHFKDLGLLIIDEEQRFGVRDKERLKKLRANVDSLVLTATPIPRTLHQSLVGIRAISSLTQAPFGRRDVESEVSEYDDALVRRAILRELDRGGQVYFVHNRVQSIAQVASKLKELVPEARYLVGHGQMAERALERTMLAFMNHEADVLVATTIIESGLDIPNANTIFVDDADSYGLSDLHQLRGRVGRYHHQAYAYFMVRKDHAISEIAEKRLRAIEEFAKLGSGFQISMRDLEIRGAGNILGAEQSGHIAAVGYELYCRLLDAAVKRIRKEEVILPEEVEINLDFTAFLPDGYIGDRRQRIEIYRRLGKATSEEQFRSLVAEMRDRFGPPPEPAQEFVLVSALRAMMERLRVNRLEILPREGVLLTSRRLARLRSMVRLPESKVRLLQGKAMLLVHPEPFSGPKSLLEFLKRSLTEGAPPRSGSAPVGPV